MRTYHHRLDKYRKKSPTKTERLTDYIAQWCGSWNFLMLHLIWFALWLVLKMDINTLTLIVSLEAIILMSILLMAQGRQAKKDDLRDEADYQIDKKSSENIDEIKSMLKNLQHKIK
ncbi:DUF1003 domain-containing protein [Patescibacteria group bacterium]|nr:DUF1003 domain-containing protein [Patescibacteria group bacterium]